jgi:hypothetical protein
VSRKGKDQTNDASWVVTFAGEDRGTWLMTYGFTYITDIFAENQAFSATATSTVGQYLVAQDRTNEKLSFVPTIMANWVPAKAMLGGNFRYVLSGGLGFDVSNPVVVLSPVGLNWNQNLTLHVGIAAAKVNRLNGKYTVGQQIGENLTPEQLQSGVYRLNPFVSLSFNFSSNPFSSPSDASKKGSTSTDKQTTKPAK